MEKVDPYRANRQFERKVFDGHETSGKADTPAPPEDGTKVAEITYDLESGEAHIEHTVDKTSED